jgi:GT2 family glycosyltransferase
MLVSIVIVNWNRKEDLEEALNSIYDNPYKNFEIIVVDNSSTDGSQEMVKTKFPDVKLIETPPNVGACKNFNVGMEEARGKIVVVMDNDALLEKNSVRKVVEEFEADERLGAVSPKVFNYYTKGLDEWVFEEDRGEYEDKEFYTYTFFGCAAAIRSEVLEKVGYYPEEYFFYNNEFALGAKIVNAGYKIKYCPSIVAYHKRSLVQRNPKMGAYYGVRNWYWYIWTYYPLKSALKHTVIHTVRQAGGAIKNKRFITFMKSVVHALVRLPSVVKRRDPIKIKFKGKIW